MSAGFALAGDIEQPEEKAVRADAAEVVEIPSIAGKISHRQVGTLKGRAIGLDNLGSRFRGGTEAEFGEQTRHEGSEVSINFAAGQ